MKKSLNIIFTMLVLLLLNSCSKENFVGIDKYSSSRGSVVLKISKTNAPPDVQQITALLTRLNYDSLQTNINALNDSLISFENVPTGKWHLRS